MICLESIPSSGRENKGSFLEEKIDDFSFQQFSFQWENHFGMRLLADSERKEPSTAAAVSETISKEGKQQFRVVWLYVLGNLRPVAFLAFRKTVSFSFFPLSLVSFHWGFAQG